MPGSAGNHLEMNARAMAAEGRAAVVLQGPGLDRDLAREAARLMGDPGLREALARPEPNRAVDLCLDDLAAKLA